MRCPNCKKDTSPWEGDVRGAYGVLLQVRGDQCQGCAELYFDSDETARQERVVASAIVERRIATGQELRFVRKMAGLKAYELAEILGVTPDTVSRWEKGKTDVPSAVAFVVGELYDRPDRTRRQFSSTTIYHEGPDLRYVRRTRGSKHTGRIHGLEVLLEVLRATDDRALVYKDAEGKLHSAGLHLPTFGGQDVDEMFIWSWDEERVIVGRTLADLEIVARGGELAKAIQRLSSSGRSVTARADSAP